MTTFASAERAAIKTGQRLTAADRVLLAVDRTVRGLGGPGFETQTQVWLSGRVRVADLRSGLERFCARYPIAVARLCEAEDGFGSWWRFRPGARCMLAEAWLESAESATVLDFAARLLSTPDLLEGNDPIRFHLLHRPDGRDVLILQYNHVLMDNNVAVPLLSELDQLCRTDADAAAGHNGGRQNIRELLRRFDRKRRREAMRDCIRLWGRCLHGGVVQLGRPSAPGSGPAKLRIAVRRLEQAQTRALQARLQQANGLPNLSMAVLGSAFRAIARLAPPTTAANFVAGIGVDLGLRRGTGTLFGNPISIVPIRTFREELGNRDELASLLGRQFRGRLQDAIDLGMLQLLPFLSRRPSETRWTLGLGLRQSFSLWYAYFGSFDGVGENFCGADVEEVFCTGPTWPPMGLTLLVNQFRGRLQFQATYLPESVPAPLADAFLDRLLDDLIQEAV
ncbi:MAG: hypothetical protein L0Y72_14015 [Gemmataceae bacterium]|nr:hypothetical protein [Gemmataceae bacterium]MCI0740158.1 hypothetical protein [Gemmataceae bacterium]